MEWIETTADLIQETDERVDVLNSEGIPTWLVKSRLSNLTVNGNVVSFSISEGYAEERGIV